MPTLSRLFFVVLAVVAPLEAAGTARLRPQGKELPKPAVSAPRPAPELERAAAEAGLGAAASGVPEAPAPEGLDAGEALIEGVAEGLKGIVAPGEEGSVEAALAETFDVQDPAAKGAPDVAAPAAQAPAPRLESASESWARKRERYADANSVATYPSQKSPPFAAGAKVVADPQEGLLAKIMLMRRARRSIDFAMYIYKRDEAGYALLGELAAAIRRGVSVRLLVDSMGSIHPFHPELKALLALGEERGASVEVSVFNPLVNLRALIQTGWRKLANFFLRKKDEYGEVARWRNRRMHDKILLVDQDDPERAIAMVGGRNAAKAYYGFPKIDAHTYDDMEIIVKGAGLKTTIAEHYDRLFFHLGNKVLGRNPLRSWEAMELKRMALATTRLLRASPGGAAAFERMTRERYLDRGFSPTSAHFVNSIENITRRNAFLKPGVDVKGHNRPNGDSLVENFRAFVQKARKSIVFVSPYFYLEPDEIERLRLWLSADASRTLTIISNSIMTTDNLPAQALVDLMGETLMRGSAWAPVRGQVKLLAFGKLDSTSYGGKAVYGKLHAKYGVIDGRVAFVGTSNADPRSRSLNSEVGFILEGGEAPARLAAEAERLAARSYLWGGDEWRRLRLRHRFKTLLEHLMGIYLRHTTLTPRLI